MEHVKIIGRLGSIAELPTLPEVMMRVHSLVSSDRGDAQELAHIIRNDPPLAAKVLKVANSAFFGGSKQRISSITLAITRIGFNEVRNIALAVGLVKHFTRQAFLLSYHAFWRHCMVAAFLAARIPRMENVRIPENDQKLLFLSGLLHDIGILVCDQHFHPEFKRIVDYALRNEIPYIEAETVIAEKEAHPFVGGALLEMWKIDPGVISAVRFHHRPDKAPEHMRQLVAVIALVEYIICNWSLGSFEGSISPPDDFVWDSIGLSSERRVELFKMAEYEVEKASVLLFAEKNTGEGPLRRI